MTGADDTVNLQTVNTSVIHLLQGNSFEQKDGEERFADEFVLKETCERVAREAAPTGWWVPTTTYAAYCDGLGPGRHGSVGPQPGVVNKVRLVTLHLARRSNLRGCPLRRRFALDHSGGRHFS